MNLTSPVILPGMKLRLTDWNNTVVKFNIHPTSQRISARWKNGIVEAVVPPGTPTRRAVEAIISMSERLDRRKPQVKFHDGQVLEFDGLRFSFGRQSLNPRNVHMTGAIHEPVIAVGTDLSYDDDKVTALISRLMMHAAMTSAPDILLPMARNEAARLSLTPSHLSISRGRRTLGHCSSKGEIALSGRCMFLSTELRRYIICHELAHLSEMNHSPRFHALCDRYLDGNEKRLIKQLKNFTWPIL